MSLYNETKFIMDKYGIYANKKLGQNFLIDESVILDTVNASNVDKEDLVIEIGPGLGALTKYLLEKAGKVIAIELDDNMIKILKDRFMLYENFELINQDVLKTDLKSLIKENKEKLKLKSAKIVANLPYYITTPIIMKLLEEKLDIESITVMVQKEVAKRLTDIPGGKNSGAITYSVYYYAQPQEIRVVENTSFIPEPEVESEVIKLNIRKQKIVEVQDEEKFFKLIKVSFMQRRKTLINAVSNSGFVEKDKFEKILNNLEIDLKVRAENLSIEQFAQIANMI